MENPGLKSLQNVHNIFHPKDIEVLSLGRGEKLTTVLILKPRLGKNEHAQLYLLLFF